MGKNEELYTFTSSLRVRYAETDKMGIAYNANYLVWFEVARTEFCRNLGKTYRGWEAQGYFLPVIESYCHFRYPANYDDLIELYCRAPIEQIKPHSILFQYKITIDRETLADGWTKHAFVNSEGKVYKKNNQFQVWLLEEGRKHCDS